MYSYSAYRGSTLSVTILIVIVMRYSDGLNLMIYVGVYNKQDV